MSTAWCEATVGRLSAHVSCLANGWFTQDVLPKEAPQTPEQLDAVLDDVMKHIMPGVTHWQHPRFFSFFPANTSPPAMLGATHVVVVSYVRVQRHDRLPAALRIARRHAVRHVWSHRVQLGGESCCHGARNHRHGLVRVECKAALGESRATWLTKAAGACSGSARRCSSPPRSCQAAREAASFKALPAKLCVPVTHTLGRYL